MTLSSLEQEFSHIELAAPDADGLIELPLILSRDAVVYPNIVSPIALNTPLNSAAADYAHKAHTTALLVAARPTEGGGRGRAEIGVEIAVARVLTMPNDTRSALVQGRRRVEIVKTVRAGGPYPIVKARILAETNPKTKRATALMQTVIGMFRRLIELNDALPDEVLVFAINAETPGWLADLILSTLTLPMEARQKGLETLDGQKRLERVAELLTDELNLLELEDEIASQVQHEMDRSQREGYLREQLQVIQNELGEGDPFQQELNEVRESIDKAKLPEEIHEKAMREYSRLGMMTPMSPEVGIVRTYLEWITALPWTTRSEDKLDLKHSQRVLDDGHYGLPKIKDRIQEYIAVRKLAPEQKSAPILCFVGPPGVGKTSLGKSIAAALGREFVRVSLGGVRDEAEIRGHRRTYIGALPGRILQTMRRAGTVNPVFMLDEIDKLGMDFRGDPSSALLEILDPEQNHAFSDHYLELPYDLSKVMFITTANDLDPLPPALLDRLEVIEFTSYTDQEKSAIARRFLIPKEAEAHGLKDLPVRLDAPALEMIIREYTYEAGVRNLDREIANVYRKVARLVAEEKRYPLHLTPKHIRRFLGPPPFEELRANDKDAVGLATGMAWTSVGGDVLTIEVSILPGKGGLTLTGSLGDVMQESAQTALSYVRSRAGDFAIEDEDFENFDIHVHLPEGSVPKEGPSAGITLALAMLSAFTERKIRSDTAMTGEITLRGKILPIGGIKEKILAARRSRITRIVMPKMNDKDLVDLPIEVRQSTEILLVEDMQQVIDYLLLEAPTGERRIDRVRRENNEDKSKSDDE